MEDQRPNETSAKSADANRVSPLIRLTSRRMVKQQEHGMTSPLTLMVVGWKKFWVVFSNACTEKFSQYVMTLDDRISHTGCATHDQEHAWTWSLTRTFQTGDICNSSSHTDRRCPFPTAYRTRDWHNISRQYVSRLR